MRGRCRLSLALALALVVAACDGDGDGAAGEPQGEARVRADLEVTAGVVDDPVARGSARLTCGPGGPSGTSWLEGAAAVRACDALADEAVRAKLDPPPADQVCAQVYGGPDVATVVGVVDGEPVDAALDRRDACAISRWDALSTLLPERRGG